MRFFLSIAGVLCLALGLLVLVVTAMSMGGQDLFLVALVVTGALSLAGIALLRRAVSLRKGA